MRQKICFTLITGRHDSIDLSAPSIMGSWVRIPIEHQHLYSIFQVSICKEKVDAIGSFQFV